MPTLYVENVPKDRYEALRERARKNRRSIAAEIVAMLEENVPTKQELKLRRDISRRLARLRAQPSPGAGPFPSAEEMIREDRAR
jgi:hypothetical protein